MSAYDAWTDPRAFLEHASWVRGLAARLAHDAHHADDLAQETWLAFLLRPSGEVRSTRRFLGGILRHRWRETRRAEERRSAREARAARADTSPAPSASEALERAELARALVDLVLGLEEPYRSAILLRYGDELAPREIAARLGVAPRTVESRLRRGLARLRERWRARYGADEGRTLSLLALLGRGAAPAAVPPAPALAGAPVSLGVLLVNTKLVLALLVAGGGGGLYWLWTLREPGASEPALAREADPARPAEPVLAPRETALAPGAPEVRQALAPEERATPTPASAQASVPLRVLHGRVLDPEARPVAGVALAFEGGGETAGATSALDGSFELSVANPNGDVRASEPALETLVAARVQGRPELELLIVVAPHRPLAGRAVDDQGRPLPGARVHLELPAGFMARFSTVLDGVLHGEWTTTTGADGGFELARAPIVADARVAGVLEGYAPGSAEAPPVASRDLELVLARPEAGRTTLSGRVVDGLRRPLAGAWVSLGGPAALSDASGEFRLERGEQREARELVALHTGFLPARFVAELDPASGAPLFPDWIELVLDAPPLVLAGRVVDADGKPRPHVYVWIAEPTPFGVFADETQAQVEFVLAQGSSANGEWLQPSWGAALTDDDGRFTFPGLLERDYALVLYDSERLERLDAGPFAAGREDLELVFPRGDLAPFRGRVVSNQGRPLANVIVFLEGETFGGVWKQGGSATTGEDGRFVFEEVGNARVSLWLRGEDVIPRWDFLEARPAGELEIVLPLRCNAKIELGDAARAETFRALDGEGKILDLYEIGATGVTYRRQMQLVDGRSITFGVSEDARTLVLERGDQEVERLPLHLLPDRLNVIGP